MTAKKKYLNKTLKEESCKQYLFLYSYFFLQERNKANFLLCNVGQF